MAVSYLVHGADESYYTGKLEAYLRAKGIPYDMRRFGPASMRHCSKHTGVVQVPQVECSDGTWLVDSTLIIDYFERLRPEPRIDPKDESVRFISLLLEDYADEWLWRPAMHFRWSYPESARLVSGWLAEHLEEVPLPMFAKKAFWRWRQRRVFVRGDGVDGDTWRSTEDCYLDTLRVLEPIFTSRPYLLGERPTQADFGFFGPMFRHFFCDPTPARIMRKRAPAVHEWVARMWNINPSKVEAAPIPDRLDPLLDPLLEEVGRTYLPYLAATEAAFARREKTVSYQAKGVPWREPVKPYRVWCLSQLRQSFETLSDPAARSMETSLGKEAYGILSSRSTVRVPEVVSTLPIESRDQTRKPVDSWWR